LTITQGFALTVNDIEYPPVAGGGLSNQDATMELASSAFPLGLTAPTDPDGDAVTMTVTTLPTAGTVLLDGAAVTVGQQLSAVQFAALAYDAPLDDAGAGVDVYTLQFTYTDGNTAPLALTVTLNVTDAVDSVLTGTADADRLDGAALDDTIDGLGG